MSTNIDVVKYIESLPRLTQLYRSIKDLPNEVIETLDNPEIARTIKELDIREEILGNCGVISQLDINQAKVLITGLMPDINSITFALINPHLFHNNTKLLPSSNVSCIRTEISQYIRNKDKASMKPHKNQYQFSPDVLDFLVTLYDPTNNIGRAMVNPYQKSLLLEVSEAEVYEYTIGSLLSKVTPIIKEAYLID